MLQDAYVVHPENYISAASERIATYVRNPVTSNTITDNEDQVGPEVQDAISTKLFL